MDHPILRDLIRFHFNALNVQDKSKPWKVFVHQIRITARDNMKGLPTPEGIHQDGHAYVAQILIDRKNVKGATSTIYDQNRSNLFRHTLTQPFDTILVNDKQVWHGVTPVRQLDSSFPGTRDMLLLDFNPA